LIGGTNFFREKTRKNTKSLEILWAASLATDHEGQGNAKAEWHFSCLFVFFRG
jgi:hypothetical protein